MKDLHSSTSSELVMGLNLRPGFEVLRYQTPSVLLNIKEFLLFLCSACVVKPSDVCHDCQHTLLPTDWFFSVCACQHLHGQAGVVTCRGPRAAVWVPLLPEMMPIGTRLSRVRGWRSSEATIKRCTISCFFHNSSIPCGAESFSQHALHLEIKAWSHYNSRTCYK